MPEEPQNDNGSNASADGDVQRNAPHDATASDEATRAEDIAPDEATQDATAPGEAAPDTATERDDTEETPERDTEATAERDDTDQADERDDMPVVPKRDDADGPAEHPETDRPEHPGTGSGMGTDTDASTGAGMETGTDLGTGADRSTDAGGDADTSAGTERGDDTPDGAVTGPAVAATGDEAVAGGQAAADGHTVPDGGTVPDGRTVAGGETVADGSAAWDDAATGAEETGVPTEGAPRSAAAEPPDATKPDIIPPGEPAAAAPATAAAAGRGEPPAGKGRGKTGPGGGGPGRRSSRRARYARRTAYVLGGLLLLPIIGFVIVYLMTPIPNSTQPTAKAQQSVFLYNDGKTVIARSGSFDRRPVPLATVPRQVRDAVISAENRSFYSDSGVSVRGSARAAWATLTGGSAQGGSTITQQMVRNYYSGLSQQRTAGRKLKEIMIALKVGREKNKDWILQQYLTTIYFGRDAYGIESAADAYYNKDVKDLTPAEGAYLAAAIQLPSYAADLNVTGARAYMQARWRYVVDGMVQMKTISPQQAATMTFPEPRKQRQKSIYAGSKGYMVSQAKVELRRLGYTDNQINMGGLKVTTTFDKNLMADAKQAVESNIPAGTSKKVMTGLVSIDPSNGEVVAFYGGKDYIEQQYNDAFDAPVQAGSGFKPYVLAAALDDGESLNTYVDGSSPQTFAGTAIHNDQDENFGMVNLVTATQDSINTAYINLGQKVGLDKVVATAEKLGIPAKQLEPHKDAPTLPLGVADVTVEQQAAGYATFASEGDYHTPHVLKSVTDRDGTKRKVSERGKHVLSTTVARDATYAMQKVVDAGTGVNASLPDRNAAGKTGTTSSGKQIWFNGFIPQLTASVGIFRSDNKPLNIPGYSSYGGDLPAKIWRSYMVEADRDLPVESFGSPSVLTGGPLRPTTAPVVPRSPHPTMTRPSTRPTRPSHRPTRRPPGPPTRPPTGPPTGGPMENRDLGNPDTSG